MNDKNISTSVVIDNGSETIKLGLSGDKGPRSVFPSLISNSRHPELNIALDEMHFNVGDKAFDKRGLENISKSMLSFIIASFAHPE
jgi:actin-related protein